MHDLPTESEMYRALVNRDATYDGVFYACVKTTGIFCRSTCTARKPKRVNVEFVPTVSDAVRAGYRPCKICAPLQAAPDRPAWVDALLDEAHRGGMTRLNDEDLRRLGIEPARARRYFKKHFGVTFQAFQRAERLGRAMKCLGDGATVATAAFESGFASESGFRSAYVRLFGHPPSQGRAHGALCATWIATPLGSMIAVTHDDALVLLEFLDRDRIQTQLKSVQAHFDSVIVPGTSDVLAEVERQLAAYFDDPQSAFDIPVETFGTPFQRSVWAALREIPVGTTVSYRDVAASIGRPHAVRAVGRANGQNRIAIVIPCHRVIRADGTLSGYGGGVWRKQRLLERETHPVATAGPILTKVHTD